MAIGRKYERDIDLMLAEEFKVSPEFAAWFQGRTRFADRPANVLDVFVSRADSDGESDLVVVFEEAAGKCRFAILVEDKIDAPFQPDQEARYRKRGQAAVTRGDFAEFECALCAPQAYLDNQPAAKQFTACIPYEAIATALHDINQSARSRYRADFIATATSKSINTWTKIDDGATKTFWNAAYELACREFHLLEMKKPDLTKDSTWISFRPQRMPTMPKRIYISMKGDRGYVDLTFNNTIAADFAPKVLPLLAKDMTVHQTAASAAIRIETNGFEVADGVEAGLPKVRKAFEASARLIDFYLRHQLELDQFAAEATPV